MDEQSNWTIMDEQSNWNKTLFCWTDCSIEQVKICQNMHVLGFTNIKSFHNDVCTNIKSFHNDVILTA